MFYKFLLNIIRYIIYILYYMYIILPSQAWAKRVTFKAFKHFVPCQVMCNEIFSVFSKACLKKIAAQSMGFNPPK